MPDLVSEPQVVLLVGLAGGLALGLPARIGRFCTLGMIEDVHYGNDQSRLWMWVTALGVAIGRHAFGQHPPPNALTSCIRRSATCQWYDHLKGLRSHEIQ